MYSNTLLAAFTALTLTSSVSTQALYSKGSAVLQVDGTSYQKLIAKSNQVSIVEFYAPWCGHCKNLKPEYEKAAKSLKDLAQVAAVNCDDELNKPFCGSMGVQGFPTLKIVKPSKKPGKPIVEDYQGARSASGIIDAVKSAIPNNVKKITDKGLSAFLESNNDTAKALLFSDKGTTSALIKVLATDYLNNMNFAQIRNKEAAAVEMFGVEEYPTLIVLPGGIKEPAKYEGPFKKSAMKEFLSQFASPVSQASQEKQKPVGKKPEKASKEEATKSEEAASTFSEASASHASAEASEEAAGATSVTLEEESNPTESPDPIASPDAPKPVVLPEAPEPIPDLIEETYLKERCLGEKTSTCILALLPEVGDEELLPDNANAALSSLAEITEKHVKREGKLFPFYSIPSRNTGSVNLRNLLNLGGEKDFELIAVNARRGWWRRYEAEKYDFHSVESWVDNIRFGEGSKGRLPVELLPKSEEEEQVEVEEPVVPEHGEL
ncbi:protein disulfide-isomerase A6, partial [Lecanoromycetidae sp. Uapishka_2]